MIATETIYVFECDCSRFWRTDPGTDSFTDAIEKAKARGWRAVDGQRPDEWRCPVCSKDSQTNQGDPS